MVHDLQLKSCARMFRGMKSKLSLQETAMNWDQIEGKWKQVKGSVRKQWGELTDDDLTKMAGSRDKFVGVLQERYGIAKEEAQKRADEWAKNVREEDKTLTSRP
jgi:uncharacterized protein YjbJ (UPF0337 family)